MASTPRKQNPVAVHVMVDAMQETLDAIKERIEQKKGVEDLLDQMRRLAVPEECPICLLPLERGKALFQTACGHVFHFQCVKQCILMNQKGCPLCRKSFQEMTPPRTPLTQRHANTIFPGFVSARSLTDRMHDLHIEHALDFE